jgi:trafficking kinesin-binding protein 1
LILDLCNNDEGVDEVELLTLVEEQIPKYKLRFDTITQFSGIIFIIYFFL